MLEGGKELVWELFHSEDEDMNELLEKLREAGGTRSKSLRAAIRKRCPDLLDLYSLKQPIRLRDKKGRTGFLLNLHSKDFHHKTIAGMRSKYMFFNNAKTNKERLVLSGQFVNTGTWTLTILRPSPGESAWKALVDLSGDATLCFTIHPNGDEPPALAKQKNNNKKKKEDNRGQAAHADVGLNATSQD